MHGEKLVPLLRFEMLNIHNRSKDLQAEKLHTRVLHEFDSVWKVEQTRIHSINPRLIEPIHRHS